MPIFAYDFACLPEVVRYSAHAAQAEFTQAPQNPSTAGTPGPSQNRLQAPGADFEQARHLLAARQIR